MPSPLDLASAPQVRSWLSINSGLPNNASQTSIVSTTIAASITPGVQTVTPVSVVNMFAEMVLSINTGLADEELVVVTAVGTGTFTANFALAHTGPGITVLDQTDAIIDRLITSASNYILWRTGRGPADGSIATASPFVTPIAYTEWYDGNGNDRLYLRNSPIASVTALYINSVSIPAATGFTSPGYAIDSSGKCLVFRNSGGSAGGSRFPRSYASYPFNWSSIYSFTNGTQNIEVQYTAGYSQTPWDLTDACIKLVGWNYRSRRDSYGIKQSIRGSESITYESGWITPPDVEEVLRFYSRRSTN